MGWVIIVIIDEIYVGSDCILIGIIVWVVCVWVCIICCVIYWGSGVIIYGYFKYVNDVFIGVDGGNV